MRTNCPNCGAPYQNIEVNNKCPYCGTAYLDISSIDFDSQEPFYLRFKVHDTYITQKVKPKFGSITIQQDETIATNYFGEKLLSFTTNKEIITELSFENYFKEPIVIYQNKNK